MIRTMTFESDRYSGNKVVKFKQEYDTVTVTVVVPEIAEDTEFTLSVSDLRAIGAMFVRS